MIAYAFINKETNILSAMCTWGDNPIPEGYEVPLNSICVEISEEQYEVFKQITLQNKGIKILDINTMIYEEFEEKVVKEPTQDDYMLDLDYRLSLIELGINGGI